MISQTRSHKRLWLLIAAALITATGVSLARRDALQADAVVEAAPHRERATQKKLPAPLADMSAPTAQDLQRIKMRVPDKLPDVFVVKHWAPPTPPPQLAALISVKPLPTVTPIPTPVVPPVPVAPEFSYTYFGRVQERDGMPMVFLLKNDRIYEAAPGVVLDGSYRVDSIERGQMIVTYLPLNKQHTIAIGGS